MLDKGIVKQHVGNADRICIFSFDLILIRVRYKEKNDRDVTRLFFF